MMMMKQGKISLSTVQFGIESSLGFDNHNLLKSSNDVLKCDNQIGSPQTPGYWRVVITSIGIYSRKKGGES